MMGEEVHSDGGARGGEETEEGKVLQLLTKGVRAKLRTCNSNITRPFNRIQVLQGDLSASTFPVDVTLVNLSLNSIQEKIELEAKLHCECLNSNLNDIVDKMPPQELAVLEARIADMKQKVDDKLVRTERAASSLCLEAEDLENRRKAEVKRAP